MASSWPGSQSMITGVGMAHHSSERRVQTLPCTSPPSFSAPFSLQAAPVATTGGAESVTTGSAAVTGTVNPGGEATTYHFEYGTTDAYGLTTPDQNADRGHRPVAVRATISGLSSTTTYHYRVVATNAAGSHAAPTRRFKHRDAGRRAVDLLARGDGRGRDGRDARTPASTRASLATSVRFEYGTSTSYGTSTPDQAIGAGGSSTCPCGVAVAGLKPNTRYNFRAVATSAAGITRGVQPDLHHRQGADRRGRHALDRAPDLGQRRDVHRHRQRLRHDAGRAREAGLPLHWTVGAGRHRDLQLAAARSP